MHVHTISNSRAVFSSRCRDRRPALLNSSLGFGSVAVHFIRAGAFERCRPQLLHRQTKHQRPCKFSDARHLVPSRHVCRPSDDNHGEEHVGSDQKDVGEYQNVDC